MDNTKTLETERLILRKFAINDAEPKLLLILNFLNMKMDYIVGLWLSYSI